MKSYLKVLSKTRTKLGRQLRYNDLTKDNSQYSPGTYEKRFGGWRKALGAFVDWANEAKMPELPEQTSSQTSKRTPRNINWRLRAQVLMKDGARCKLSAATPQDGAKLHVDRIKPWANGGKTVLENLQIFCEKCSIGKSKVEI